MIIIIIFNKHNEMWCKLYDDDTHTKLQLNKIVLNK